MENLIIDDSATLYNKECGLTFLYEAQISYGHKLCNIEHIITTCTHNVGIQMINIKIRGNYLFSHELPKNARCPMNYQLDQNRAFNYQRQPFSPIPSVKWVKTNGQRVT
jgi:hypothetical protein